MTFPRMARVTSLINQRSSCLRSANVVVGAWKTSWQIISQLADLLALGGRKREHCLFGHDRILPLQLFHLGQFLIPLPLQAAGHQSIFRVNGSVASTCQIRLILGTLNLALPLLVDLPSTCLQLVKRREGYLQVSWLDRFQEAVHNGFI